MPIASGANAWPTQYYNKVDPKPEPPKIYPPPKGGPRPQTVVIKEDLPPPQPRPREPITPPRGPSPVRREIVRVQEPYQPPPPRRKRGPCNDTCVGSPCCIGGLCYPRQPGPSEGCCKYGCIGGCGACCCTGGFWEPIDTFNNPSPYNTGGCCGSPYEYNKGTKKDCCRRCCTVFLGLLLPLLLIGAIIAAVILLQNSADEARTAGAQEAYPDGYFENGVFYVPIVQGDTYYAVKGQPAIDACWKAWSTLMAITPSVGPRVVRTETTTVVTPLPSTVPTVPTVPTIPTEAEYTGTVTATTEEMTIETTEGMTTTPPTTPVTMPTTTPIPSRQPRYTTVTVSLPDCFALTTRIDFVRREESRDPVYLFLMSSSGVKNYFSSVLCMTVLYSIHMLL